MIATGLPGVDPILSPKSRIPNVFEELLAAYGRSYYAAGILPSTVMCARLHKAHTLLLGDKRSPH